jgi:DNA-binding GntR family transcriptional regulator
MTTEGQLSLPYSPVDPHSPVPLYHQVYLDLRQMIQRGVISPGDMLPPELDICQAYSVARQTVRQAIARLVYEDLVERFAGRGTFVREPNHIQFFLDRSFSQQMREMGRIPHSRLLSQQIGIVNVESVPALHTYQRASCLTLERLRLGDAESICHQTSTILRERCPGIEQHDFAS